MDCVFLWKYVENISLPLCILRSCGFLSIVNVGLWRFGFCDILSKRMEGLPQHTMKWALLELQILSRVQQVTVQVSALFHLPCTPGFTGTLEMSQSLSIELGLACHGSLLSAAPQPRLPPLVPSRRTMTASLADSFSSLPPSCASGQGSGKSHKNGNHPPPPELVASFKFQLP